MATLRAQIMTQLQFIVFRKLFFRPKIGWLRGFMQALWALLDWTAQWFLNILRSFRFRFFCEHSNKFIKNSRFNFLFFKNQEWFEDLPEVHKTPEKFKRCAADVSISNNCYPCQFSYRMRNKNLKKIFINRFCP